MELGSSSSSSRSNDSVFLSFCVEDSGKGFASHLKHYLSRKGFDTASIEDSKCCIVIFSPNYASSTSRLDQIIRILEYKEKKGLTVIPVFYKVDPTDVRKVNGTFGEAFAQHGEDRRAQSWRDALKDITSIAGFHFHNRDEAELIGKIAAAVSSKLMSNSTAAASFNFNNIYRGIFGINSTRLNSYCASTLRGPTHFFYTFFFWQFL
ncbi:putative disease resistance protein At4g11170 [Humulus lupulus]|uniref:putative disease resistance protein At4g11170 n=1 Tax=Humulus lupulus TaxID=3486 RepID=UPI002B412B90|nr:putative disease resistance protein At4g11170 [Humulus lupulus]